MIKIAASILSADFANLGANVKDAEDGGADYIHVDVMDGHFVPNITIGPLIAAAVRRSTHLPLDVHLMIEAPERYIGDFAGAGADIITVHVETCPHLQRTVQQIRELGVKAGVTLNPATSLETVREVLPYIDQVLVMTVNPGFGGQSYIPTMTGKVARLARMIDELAPDAGPVDIEVDGGIDADTTAAVVQAGARVLVAGTAVFRHPGGVGAGIAALRGAATRALA